MRKYLVVIYMVYNDEVETYTSSFLTKEEATKLVNQKKDHPLLGGIRVSYLGYREPARHMWIAGRLNEEFQNSLVGYEIQNLKIDFQR